MTEAFQRILSMSFSDLSDTGIAASVAENSQMGKRIALGACCTAPVATDLNRE